MDRLRKILEGNQQRVLWFFFFVSYGYVAVGWEGALIQFALFGSLIALSVLAPYIRKVWQYFLAGGEGVREKAVDDRRLVFVRVQEPHALLVPLRVGGTMATMTWQDVAGVRYDTYPEEALERALEEYDGYRISHYVEQNPDVEIDEPLEEIGEEAWIQVVPERDLPQEEE